MGTQYRGKDEFVCINGQELHGLSFGLIPDSDYISLDSTTYPLNPKYKPCVFCD